MTRIAADPLAEPQPPPLVPEHWVVAPPDFVGVGAQRCGTTRWFDLITNHPEVEPPLSTRKELRYFLAFWTDDPTLDELSGYQSYFPRPRGKLTGEWSPRYLHDSWTLALLKRAAPDARILVSLRDPFDRYCSALTRWLGVLEGDEHVAPQLAMSLAMEGLYAAQLHHLFREFPREQVLILQYERCVVDTAAEIARTFRFLGIDDSYVPTNLDAHPNLRPHKHEISETVARYLRRLYRADLRQLASVAPEIDMALWRSFSP
jgi:hypothetical protein